MADKRQFGGSGSGGGKGGGGMRQFGDQAPVDQPGTSEHCAQCEAMLTDAIDGTLTAEQQTSFDLHASHCGPCGELVADARRGAAWLEMLRTPAPQPPAELLERILVQTSGSVVTGPVTIAPARLAAEAAMAPGYAGGYVPGYAAGYAAGYAPGSGKLIAFPRRAVAAVRSTSIGNIVLQPRLAMTAAMAFFSVALTMNITGFHPGSLHASDLEPGNLRKQFYHANASVVRYYEGLRVVYELESRVHELQTAQDLDVPAGSGAAPANSAQPVATPGNPAPGTLAPGILAPGKQAEPPNQTAPSGHKPAGGPSGRKGQADPEKPAEPGKPAANPDANRGTSRREELNPTRQFVVDERLTPKPSGTMRSRTERKLV